MSVEAILAPVFVQVALTFFLLFWTGSARVAALRGGLVKMSDIALGERNWPSRVTRISNTYENQFETPVLFYALVILALVTRQADLLFVILSWIFVAARLAHAFIYTTSNALLWRFRVFLAGTTTLLLMWALFAAKILTGHGTV